MFIAPYIGYKEIALACVSEAKTQVKNAYLWAGRKVEVLSKEHLPETAAKVATTFYWALPYTAALLLMPTWIRDITSTLTIGLWSACPREIDLAAGIENRKSLYIGIRNACVISLAVNTVRMIATRDIFLLAQIVGDLYFAVQCQAIIPEPTPEPKPDEAVVAPATQ